MSLQNSITVDDTSPDIKYVGPWHFVDLGIAYNKYVIYDLRHIFSDLTLDFASRTSHMTDVPNAIISYQFTGQISAKDSQQNTNTDSCRICDKYVRCSWCNINIGDTHIFVHRRFQVCGDVHCCDSRWC
jgi:hypothetical protein